MRNSGESSVSQVVPIAVARVVIIGRNIVVPWLELPEDQQDLYGHVFENPAAQEAYIRNWLKEQAEMPDVACSETGLHIVFYPARYHSGLRSIFAMGDMLRMIEEESTPLDVCILEEPEHGEFVCFSGRIICLTCWM